MSSTLREKDIRKVVTSFYAAVREDDLLAPIFATRIKSDEWDTHEDHILSFWSSIFLKTKQFKGNPMHKHAALTGLTPKHFSHWLSLFQETTQRVLTPEKASLMIEMARSISESLQMGLAFNYEKSGQNDHPFTEFGIRRSH